MPQWKRRKGVEMHATIQKPLEEILGFFGEAEKVFVVGCGNCAAKAKSGGEPETQAMAERLEAAGLTVTGWAVPPDGGSLCFLDDTTRLLTVEHKEEVERADAVLVLACGQGVHTVIDATDGANAYPGCDTIFGGETVSANRIEECCSLCGECIVGLTGGLCPLTLCAKGLLNGPCGGAREGKCEVDPNRDCGWHLIYERLEALGRLDLMRRYVPPKNRAKSSVPRSLDLGGCRATFAFGRESTTAWSCAEAQPEAVAAGEDA